MYQYIYSLSAVGQIVMGGAVIAAVIGVLLIIGFVWMRSGQSAAYALPDTGAAAAGTAATGATTGAAAAGTAATGATTGATTGAATGAAAGAATNTIVTSNLAAAQAAAAQYLAAAQAVKAAAANAAAVLASADMESDHVMATTGYQIQSEAKITTTQAALAARATDLAGAAANYAAALAAWTPATTLSTLLGAGPAAQTLATGADAIVQDIQAQAKSIQGFINLSTGQQPGDSMLTTRHERMEAWRDSIYATSKAVDKIQPALAAVQAAAQSLEAAALGVL